ncbi:hypothetical protein PBI_CJW1_107 [Mycobacterium phage Cjw1]|uniref:Uncharacterized protein n=3 Tax=Kostyavirus TaxID=1623284 RepID=Q857Q4_9CAUD|nr:gp108 [Mycobacterium phage Cjw1]YP_008051731.1 hypothetical protein PBI_DUMBO_106 [Mycobacterium phage Dumbo]YP_654862.1 gp107 [Mycobacterium phage 244]AEK08990.1 hypothetical protein PBI_HENRY_104 [Mycobacterium phage Henry]AAN01722.1 hypothetical protein PBI_CJW1_107 [Mycobacterium phage Cjw1]ABD58082.1 hypothetical protein PBI_244_107 [Mycobacterium phage 244]AGM12847.1 hypothetical protein PBI_DUMBO_106 [Mycobacterium phage Dumbo]
MVRRGLVMVAQLHKGATAPSVRHHRLNGAHMARSSVR